MLRPFSLALASGASVFLLGTLFLAGGRDNRPTHYDLTTLWISRHGFTVDVHRDGRYTFCDGDRCFTDRWVGPGIKLLRFRTHGETERFRLVEEALDESFRDEPDLNFSPTGGMGPRQWCDGDPCVIFGDIEYPGNNMIFRRREDLH